MSNNKIWGGGPNDNADAGLSFEPADSPADLNFGATNEPQDGDFTDEPVVDVETKTAKGRSGKNFVILGIVGVASLAVVAGIGMKVMSIISPPSESRPASGEMAPLDALPQTAQNQPGNTMPGASGAPVDSVQPGMAPSGAPGMPPGMVGAPGDMIQPGMASGAPAGSAPGQPPGAPVLGPDGRPLGVPPGVMAQPPAGVINPNEPPMGVAPGQPPQPPMGAQPAAVARPAQGQLPSGAPQAVGASASAPGVPQQVFDQVNSENASLKTKVGELESQAANLTRMLDEARQSKAKPAAQPKVSSEPRKTSASSGARKDTAVAMSDAKPRANRSSGSSKKPSQVIDEPAGSSGRALLSSFKIYSIYPNSGDFLSAHIVDASGKGQVVKVGEPIKGSGARVTAIDPNSWKVMTTDGEIR